MGKNTRDDMQWPMGPDGSERWMWHVGPTVS
jgi:hypothetical protein